MGSTGFNLLPRPHRVYAVRGVELHHRLVDELGALLKRQHRAVQHLGLPALVAQLGAHRVVAVQVEFESNFLKPRISLYRY
jgi:hypothetical protein